MERCIESDDLSELGEIMERELTIYYTVSRRPNAADALPLQLYNESLRIFIRRAVRSQERTFKRLRGFLRDAAKPCGERVKACRCIFGRK